MDCGTVNWELVLVGIEKAADEMTVNMNEVVKIHGGYV